MASVVDLVWSVQRAYGRVNRGIEERVPAPVLFAAGYLPIVVFVVAGLGWVTLTLALPVETVQTPLPDWLDPVGLLGGAVFHSGPGHYWGNVWFVVPFGVVLTWLTNNRHVLAVVVVPQYLSAACFTLFTGATVVGASGVAFAFLGAVLVRAVGLTFRSTSTETLLAAILGAVCPFLVALFLLRLFVGVTSVAHMGHLLSFTVATALETGAVLSAHDGEGEGPGIQFSPGL